MKDVAILGYGPVGALLANLLGQAGLSVAVYERETAIFPLPRAVHFDGEVMRIFQSAGLAECIAAAARPSSQGMHFVNAAGQTLMVRRGVEGRGPQGWPNNWYFHQPALEEILRLKPSAAKGRFIKKATMSTTMGPGIPLDSSRVRNLLDPDSMVRAIHVASGLGTSSAHTWLKLPVVDDLARVMDATTLPTLLLGGDPQGAPKETYAAWGRSLGLPAVRGLVVGRALLYPPDGDVASAVDIAADLVHGGVA